MWNVVNSIIIVLEMILIIAGVIGLFKKKSVAGTLIFTGAVFAINMALYCIPFLYGVLVLNKEENFLFELLACFNSTMKQFAGDVKPERIAEYASVFKVYNRMFEIGTVLAVFTTVSAAIIVFGQKTVNGFRVTRRLNAHSCDIVPGHSEYALKYAKSNKNTVLVVDESVDKEYAISLMEAGYAVIRRKLNVDFLRSRYLNKKTRYHVIYVNDGKNFLENIKMFISYLATDYDKKNVRFYVEVEEKIMETVKNKIADIGRSKKDSADKTAFEECITLFSKNELLARTLVEANPVTKYMPADFICGDTSIKPDKKINVFMLGFGDLSKEIYRQFVMNNQLVVNTCGEYKVFPVKYYIYDESVNENEWFINGLKCALEGIAQRKELYFTLPEMPYVTECIKGNPFYADFAGISKLVGDSDSLTYFFVDAGDAYRNMEISEKLRLLLEEQDNYHIFVHDEANLVCGSDRLTGYGDFGKLFTHGIIVNEKLIDLAKSIDKVYFRMFNNLTGKTESEISELHKKSWCKQSYFNIYSNIYLASNLRLKLGLLGLDYVEDGKGEGLELIKEMYGTYENPEYSGYFGISKRNALIAQEHFRWNAYHLMSGYLPMKKERIEISLDEKTQKIKKSIKNNSLKKHACLTTFNGLDSLSEYIAEKANECTAGGNYTASDFDYYENDEMMFKNVAYDYLKSCDCSVIKKY